MAATSADDARGDDAVSGAVGEPELLLERRGPVLVATINRPAAMNTLSPGLRQELAATWTGLDPGVRAIVITGAGDRAFCTGMDLKAAAAQGAMRPLEPDVHRALCYTPLNFDVWLPTVVAVNGVCAAAGFHFLADADVIVAADTATFVDTHVSVGQVTAVEPITLLPRIGLGNALRLAVLGRAGRMDAAEARRISLVDEVVPAGELLERAVALATAAASGSPAAVEASKRAIRGALERPMGEALQAGWELLLANRDHFDALEGARAFAERRQPRWQSGPTGPAAAGEVDGDPVEGEQVEAEHVEAEHVEAEHVEAEHVEGEEAT